MGTSKGCSSKQVWCGHLAGSARCLPPCPALDASCPRTRDHPLQPSHPNNLVLEGLPSSRGGVHLRVTRFWVRKQTCGLLLSGKETVFQGRAGPLHPHPAPHVASENPFRVNSPQAPVVACRPPVLELPQVPPTASRLTGLLPTAPPGHPAPRPGGGGAPGPRGGAGGGEVPGLRGAGGGSRPARWPSAGHLQTLPPHPRP